jgi:hypothetical protein
MKNFAAHLVFATAATALFAEPDWKRPTVGTPVVLHVDHGFHRRDEAIKPEKWIRPSPLKKTSNKNEFATNLEITIYVAEAFPKNSQVSKEDATLFHRAFMDASWVDVFNDGVVGNAPSGSLIFLDQGNKNLAWVLEFWEKSVRLFPAKKCGGRFFQNMIYGRSTSLNGEAGVRLAQIGHQLLEAEKLFNSGTP